MDIHSRHKPLGAIVAWGSLVVFAIVAIVGIAGVVMGLQHRPAPAPVETAAVPAKTTERLPDLQTAEAAPVVADDPKAKAIAEHDALIAATFAQLPKAQILASSPQPAEQAVAAVPAAAVATPAESHVDLPMKRGTATALAVQSRAFVDRNAAAWAIDKVVPDSRTDTGTALAYAAPVVPAPGPAVGDSSINVRSGPSGNSGKVFALSAGAPLSVTGKQGGWVTIKDTKGRIGWVDATLLANIDLDKIPVAKDVVTDAPAAAPTKSADSRKVGGAGVTVRSGPGKSNRGLFTLVAGSDVTVLDDEKGWLKIKDAKGRTGWAYKSYIR